MRRERLKANSGSRNLKRIQRTGVNFRVEGVEKYNFLSSRATSRSTFSTVVERVRGSCEESAHVSLPR
jgi:hypothetical protein